MHDVYRKPHLGTSHTVVPIWGWAALKGPMTFSGGTLTLGEGSVTFTGGTVTVRDDTSPLVNT